MVFSYMCSLCRSLTSPPEFKLLGLRLRLYIYIYVSLALFSAVTRTPTPEFQGQGKRCHLSKSKGVLPALNIVLNEEVI